MSSIEIKIPVSSTSPNFVLSAVPKDFMDEDKFMYAPINGGIEVSSCFNLRFNNL